MAFDPKPGQVVRYDFLWKDQERAGQQDGSKDRPCAIVLATKPKADGSRQVLLAPITHSPVGSGESGIEMPAKVSRHLGLDDDRSWIKTHEVNLLHCEAGKTPFGITPVKKGVWTYGELPRALSEKVVSQVRERSQERSLANVRRDFPDDSARSWEEKTGRAKDKQQPKKQPKRKKSR